MYFSDSQNPHASDGDGMMGGGGGGGGLPITVSFLILLGGQLCDVDLYWSYLWCLEGQLSDIWVVLITYLTFMGSALW